MQAYLAQLYTLAYLGDDYWHLSEYILKMRLIGADLNAAYKFTKRVTDKGGVQFLSDKLSEVSKNRHKFLHVDFAAVSEKIDVLFVFVSTFLEIVVYRPVTQRFLPLSTESHR